MRINTRFGAHLTGKPVLGLEAAHAAAHERFEESRERVDDLERIGFYAPIQAITCACLSRTCVMRRAIATRRATQCHARV